MNPRFYLNGLCFINCALNSSCASGSCCPVCLTRNYNRLSAFGLGFDCQDASRCHGQNQSQHSQNAQQSFHAFLHFRYPPNKNLNFKLFGYAESGRSLAGWSKKSMCHAEGRLAFGGRASGGMAQNDRSAFWGPRKGLPCCLHDWVFLLGKRYVVYIIFHQNIRFLTDG